MMDGAMAPLSPRLRKVLLEPRFWALRDMADGIDACASTTLAIRAAQRVYGILW